MRIDPVDRLPVPAAHEHAEVPGLIDTAAVHEQHSGSLLPSQHRGSIVGDLGIDAT
ncbi:hypothetical protein M3B11_01745 [Brevibacterium sp. p3-SID960]|uniref:hypothetical protein n=1 Tax=Brevibacterium sp. p3-SID960 TaxID=2916063 RepID=UPI0021A56D39|nr:hypothetical protein [Brevibacterium sp. p3-SID960]MCT1689689.1 hypothetical protein [Brevibacterium sp. p3-SID960]